MYLRETMSAEDFAAECRDIDDSHIRAYIADRDTRRPLGFSYIEWQKPPEPVFYPYFMAISGIIKFLQAHK